MTSDRRPSRRTQTASGRQLLSADRLWVQARDAYQAQLMAQLIARFMAQVMAQVMAPVMAQVMAPVMAQLTAQLMARQGGHR